MKMVPQSASMHIEEAPQNLELNPDHPIIEGLDQAMKRGETELAEDIVRQVSR
jgi:hypothetical protein